MEVCDAYTKSLLPTLVDYLIIVVYLLIIYIVCRSIKAKHITKNPEYKYFIPGLFIKILGGILFCLVYIFYYKEGGDTTNYFRNSIVLSNMLNKDPFAYFSIMLGNLNEYNYSLFDQNTGWPWFYQHDTQAYAVVRFINPFLLLSFKNYFTTTILLSVMAYFGIWKFFQMFCRLFPKHMKFFAFSILFFPSIVFWGSGILKDTFTLSAACWYTYNFYKIFIKKKDIAANIILMILNIYLILSLKPYIIVALFPGSIIWGFYDKIIRIKNKTTRFIISPFIVIIAFLLANMAFNFFKKDLGKYSDLEGMIKKAQVTQQDLIRAEQYGINYHNIGEFKTTADIAKKSPQAIIAGLYRPFLWEANTIFMFLSGVENLFLLLLTLYVFIGSGAFLKSTRNIIKDPLLLFIFLFSIFFAFSIGLSTANFGALVRYKIPLLPFFTSGLLILYIKKNNYYNL